MSQLNGRALREALSAALMRVEGIEEIVFGRTLKRKRQGGGFARVVMGEVSQVSGDNTMSRAAWGYEFFIGLTFPMSEAEGQTLPDVQEDKLNQLAALLRNATTFSGADAYLPTVGKFMFDDEAESDEPTFECALEFSCRLHTPHIVT